MVVLSLSIIYFLSGYAALAFQTIWLKYISYAIGSSSTAVIITVSTFMGGLAIGNLIFGKKSSNSNQPLALFALLLFLIGIFGALVPTLISFIENLGVNLFSAMNIGYDVTLVNVFKIVLCVFTLLIPTILMGGTFPLICEATARLKLNTKRTVPLLYSANVFGAVAGTLSVAFLMIPILGMTKSLIFTSVILFIAVVLTITFEKLFQRKMEKDEGKVPEKVIIKNAFSGRTNVILCAFITGFCGLALEFIWIRIFSCYLTSISYIFSIILSIYLVGLFIGSMIVAPWKFSNRVGKIIFFVTQILLFIAVFISISTLDETRTFPGTILTAFGGSEWSKYIREVVSDVLIVILPTCVLMGVSFGTLCKLVQGDGKKTGISVGLLSCANSIGSIAGFTITPLFIIPFIGNYHYDLLIIASLYLLSALLFYATSISKMTTKIAVSFSSVVLVIVIFFVLRLNVSEKPFFLKKIDTAGKDVNVLYYKDGRMMTVTVVELNNRNRVLYMDSFQMAGKGDDYAYMRMLGHFPAMLSDVDKNALVVGLGTGTTAGVLSLYPFEKLHIVEITSDILECTKYFSDLNKNLHKKLETDSRIKIFFEDARTYLKFCKDKYDVITVEPPLPYLSGAISLYSKEFYNECYKKLTKTGVICQWIPIDATGLEDVKILIKTFSEVFDNVYLWYFRESLVLSGHKLRPNFNILRVEKFFKDEEIYKDLVEINYNNPYAILSSYICSARDIEELTKYCPVLTYDNPVIEYFDYKKGIREAHIENLKMMISKRGELDINVYNDLSLGKRWDANRNINLFKRGSELLYKGRLAQIKAQKSLVKGDLEKTQELYNDCLILYQGSLRHNPYDPRAWNLLLELCDKFKIKLSELDAGLTSEVKDLDRLKLAVLYSELKGEIQRYEYKKSPIAEILDKLENGTDSEKIYCLNELVLYYDNELTEYICVALNDKSEIVREAAVELLIKNRDDGIIKYIEDCIEDPSDLVRMALLKGVVSYKKNYAEKFLRRGIRDSDPFIREYAMTELIKITGKTRAEIESIVKDER